MHGLGVPIVVHWKRIRLGTMRLWVRSLASLSELKIWHCYELWCRLQTLLGPILLWLWRRPAASAPIRPLAWEPSCAKGVALKRKKKKKKDAQLGLSLREGSSWVINVHLSSHWLLTEVIFQISVPPGHRILNHEVIPSMSFSSHCKTLPFLQKP